MCVCVPCMDMVICCVPLCLLCVVVCADVAKAVVIAHILMVVFQCSGRILVWRGKRGIERGEVAPSLCFVTVSLLICLKSL